MLYPTAPDDFRRRRLIVAAVTAALLLAAFITYAVLSSRSSSSGADRVMPADDWRSGSATSEPAVVELPALRPTRDPDAFAREVAEALFAWDTATLVVRADHIEQLMGIADPTGESTAGLLSDLHGYLPTPDAWVELAQYETRQWLTIDSIATPSKWAEAEEQAGDALLPGTTAFTVHGTRHRSGIWEGEPVSSEHDVAFTVFIVCGPSYPECHLLRLSILDKPLD